MDIPNINNRFSPSTTPHRSPLFQELNHMIQVYRNLMKNYSANPNLKNKDKMIEFVYKLRSFLEHHRKELFSAEKAQGWPQYDTHDSDGYEGIYNTCMIGINTFLDPETSNPGNLDYVNEQITQLHWMLDHHPGNRS